MLTSIVSSKLANRVNVISNSSCIALLRFLIKRLADHIYRVLMHKSMISEKTLEKISDDICDISSDAKESLETIRIIARRRKNIIAIADTSHVR